MKKYRDRLFLFLCSLLLLTSCRNTQVDEMIRDKLAAENESLAVDESSSVDESASDTKTPETTDGAASSSLTADVDGILSEHYTFNDNKYYFVTRKEGGYTEDSMLTYYDFQTGKNRIICPDPLCGHENVESCKYVGFEKPWFVSPGVFYGIRFHGDNPAICRVDLNEDTVKVVYTSNAPILEAVWMDGLTFYFYEVQLGTEETQWQTEYHLYAMDGSTDQVKEVSNVTELLLSGNILLIHDGTLYCDWNRALVRCGLDLQNQTELHRFSAGEQISQWCYDTNTEEFYFSVCNQSEQTGSLYVSSKGETTEVPLGAEIYTFTLTQDKLYYSLYDPIFYGISNDPGHSEVYDYSGGKVYVADRKAPKTGELLYDCGGESVLCVASVFNYVVVGNSLFFDDVAIVRETINGVDYTYFALSRELGMNRVDLTTGETELIEFPT